MAVVAMNPSWAVMAGGSSLSVSPPQRKVRVLAADAVDAAAAGLAASVGFAASAGLAASVGLAAAGALVAAGGAGCWLPQADSRPIPKVAPASCRKLRRLTGDDRMARPSSRSSAHRPRADVRLRRSARPDDRDDTTCSSTLLVGPRPPGSDVPSIASRSPCCRYASGTSGGNLVL